MKTLLSLIKTRWLPLTICLLVTIAILSLWPLDSLPPVPGSDKTHHFIAYMALMFPAALARPRHTLLIGFGFIVFSGLIELLQPFVNRYGEWLDLSANIAGILCGVLAAAICRWLEKRLSDRQETPEQI